MIRWTAITLACLFAGVLPRLYAEFPEQAEPFPPAEAARTMVVPEGFHVSLFAGEPDVKQPIGFCIDDRGRLWVAEAYSYPEHDTQGQDRIVILEDTDGDGTFNDRTVFYDKLNYVTGIEVGFGGVWVMSPPFFFFIPDEDQDDVPDSEPKVLLDGFGNHANSHNLANAFAWGPDGWLYGTHGRTNWSMIGKSDTPEEERIRFDGGVYRYHPTRHVWEAFADGTTNPWGIDWDDYGQAFVCNCVNPHLFHVIQGAHYEPWRNRESSQHAYERITTIADHLHFIGEENVRDGLGTPEEDAAGGGHAHCGTLIYLGDNWPDRYRNSVLMNNIHGHRINNDVLLRKGSGYVATHGRDVMLSKDGWYMGVTLLYGPDGSVFASDWSDTGECHSVKNTQRATGRIFKITYGQPAHHPVNVGALSDAELVGLQLHKNDWHVRHARRVLQERAAAGHDLSEVHAALLAMFHQQSEVPRKLRALWALRVTEGLSPEFLNEQLSHDNEHIRSWAIRLLSEEEKWLTDSLDRFEELAESDASELVRLHLASALQRVPLNQRWGISEKLAAHGEDTTDQNLPYMVWYAVEPLVDDDLERFIDLAGKTRIPMVRRHIARRAASIAQPQDALRRLVALLLGTDEVARQQDLLTGILQGLEGRRSVAMPSEWPAVYQRLERSSSDDVREASLQLALIFNDTSALARLRALAADATAFPARRTRAIEALVSKKVSDLAPLLLELVRDPQTQSAALHGLAEYDHPQTSERILELYDTLTPAGRQDALQTLASRRPWATNLLDAVEAKKISSGEISAYTARQLQNFNDDILTKRLESLWGRLGRTSADKAKMIAQLKSQLSAESLARADRPAGRAIFQKTCANCHRLFGTGGDIGPEITGSQRTSLDYLLENIVDPSASVAKDFQMQIFETTSGRIVTGLVLSQTPAAVTIQTVNEKLVLPLDEIESQTASNLSLMPESTLQNLSIQEIRNLVGYLSSPIQVPLPE